MHKICISHRATCLVWTCCFQETKVQRWCVAAGRHVASNDLQDQVKKRPPPLSTDCTQQLLAHGQSLTNQMHPHTIVGCSVHFHEDITGYSVNSICNTYERTMYELTGTSIVTGNNKLNAWHHSVCSLWRHIVLKLYSVSRVRNKWQLSNQKGFLSWIRWYLGVSIKCSSIVMYGYINVHVHCTIITHWSYNSYMMHAVHSRSFTHSKLNVHFMQDFWR